MTVKRPLENDTEIETMAMANCLMLLSRVGKKTGSEYSPAEPGGRLFYCKTCNRPFQSFQALGGHRASHKRPKLNDHLLNMQFHPPKPKTHECSVCGQEFAIGQALGGHMRRHRDQLVTSKISVNQTVVKNDEKRSLVLDLDLDLDLNLMPYENDLRLWPINVT